MTIRTRAIALACCLAAALVTHPSLVAQSPPAASSPGLHLGAAWYPEHWPESRWPEDIRLMREAGITVVRVGEFAWSTLEPREGVFELDWLDRAIALAAKNGLAVVVGTPSAAPPAWLTQKYPETLRVDEQGRPATHGNRVHFRFTSERYRQLAARIAGRMAQRWGRHPAVIGWQIDNEYSGASYDPETRRLFQEWLAARYKTLDSLNEHWATAYWSQTYSDWSQIPIPIGPHNPALRLEWQRFVSDTWRAYQKVQIDAIRAHADSRQWITHNFMGWHDSFDHYVVTADLDLASWDNYTGSGHLNPSFNGVLHDLTRGFKRKPFWLMETQPGSVNWADVNVTLDKGEVRAMAWHAIGHGADAVSYWQWRSAPGGQEQYHGSLIAQDGQPRPVYDEIAQVGREFGKAGDVLLGTSPRPAVAMLHSYDSRWAITFQRHHRDFDQLRSFESFYRPLRAITHGIDVVHPDAPLDGYRLVVAPWLQVLPGSTATKLLAWVKAGGHLVLGPRSGMKDEYNALHPIRQPGPLAADAGARVSEFYALDRAVPVSGAWGSGEATIWAERLQTTAADVEVLLTYGASNGWLDAQPAVTTRKVGKGRITYVGAWLDPATLDRAARWMVETSGIQPPMGAAPPGVEVSHRTGDRGDVFIVVNHTRERQEITLPRPMRDVLTDRELSATVPLGPRDVLVLTPAR